MVRVLTNKNIGCSKPKNNKPITIKSPKGSIESSILPTLLFAILLRILPPSSGGTGIRLKIIKIKFIKIPVSHIVFKKIIIFEFPILIIELNRYNKTTQNIVIIKLAIGPAIATKNISFFGLFKFTGLIGTGLAQPKTKPPIYNKRPGSNKVPMGSMCAIGFKVNLPCISAVRSPYCFATQP